MKFSVVIPLYNGAKLIEATLDSVLAQIYRDYEIILVNDESPDNVDEVVRKYICTHPHAKFIYIEQKNKGLGGARNTAIRHATGEIIAILDQDDIWYPEKLEKVRRVFEKNPEVAIVCHNQYIRKNGRIVAVNLTGPYQKDMYRKLLFEGNCLSTSATAFKKSLVEELGYFSEELENFHLCEDYDLWLRAAYAGYKFYFIPEILGEYVRHEMNYAATNCVPMFKGDIYITSLHYARLKAKGPLDWIKFRYLKANLYYRIAYHVFRSSGSFTRSSPYFIKTLINNPMLIFILGKGLIRMIIKTILSKGVKQ